MSNLFTNFGDAAIAVIVTVATVLLALLGQGWVTIILVVFSLLLIKTKQLIPGIAAFMVAILVWKIELFIWVVLSISLWAGCFCNLLWEIGGNQFLTGFFHLSNPLPQKAPGMLNYGVTIVLFVLLLPITQGGFFLLELIEDGIDNFVYADLWQQILVVLGLLVFVAIGVFLFLKKKKKTPSSPPSGEEDDEVEEDFFHPTEA